MDDIQRLMVELDGADAETVHRLAWERGSLPVRLAMLGLAAVGMGERPLWWGYPPAVFIGYKWDGGEMARRVEALADYVRSRGYRACLDREHLAADAGAYGDIPGYIARLLECQFYVLLLTARGADLVDARGNKTSWLHEELQLAIRRANTGRLALVPVLLEPDGMVDALRGAPYLDLTTDPRGFTALDGVLTLHPLALDAGRTAVLGESMAAFDSSFLSSQWEAAADHLEQASAYTDTFDHGLRRMLLALYTADGPAFERAFDRLCSDHGRNVTLHVYRGYCARHGIPVRITPP